MRMEGRDEALAKDGLLVGPPQVTGAPRRPASLVAAPAMSAPAIVPRRSGWCPPAPRRAAARPEARRPAPGDLGSGGAQSRTDADRPARIASSDTPESARTIPSSIPGGLRPRAGGERLRAAERRRERHSGMRRTARPARDHPAGWGRRLCCPSAWRSGPTRSTTTWRTAIGGSARVDACSGPLSDVPARAAHRASWTPVAGPAATSWSSAGSGRPRVSICLHMRLSSATGVVWPASVRPRSRTCPTRTAASTSCSRPT